MKDIAFPSLPVPRARPGISRRRLAGLAVCAALAGVAAGTALAQTAATFPSRPIRIIVPFVPGGTTDVLSRFIGQVMAQDWNQSVVVDNKPGAGSIIGTEMIAKAPADGYTIGMVVSAHTIQPAMDPKPPYHPVDDFTFITLATRVPKVILAHPGVPANNLKELLDLVRTNPGKYASFGTSGVGSAAHLGMELINTLAQVKFVHVPYKGTGAAVTDLMGGQIPLVVADINNAIPLVKSGKAKAVVVLGSSRSAQLPGVGTLGDVYPGQSVFELYGLVGPKGMPADVTDKLRAEITRILSSAQAKERFTNELGIEFSNSTPEEFRAAVTADTARWGKVIRDANIKIE